MKRLSFIPEIFIWLAFFIVAGFGYAFSFFQYLETRAPMSITDIIIPSLVWVLLAAICTLLLRIIQNTGCFVKLSKGEGLFLECSIFALLLIGGWVFRFVHYFHGVWPAGVDNSFFQFAEVSQNAAVYLNPHPASRLYVAFLHTVCLFFGNIYKIGAIVQYILLLAAVGVWYFVIRKALDVTTALFMVAGAMLLPESIAMSMQCNPLMLLCFVYGMIAWLIVWYAYSKVTGFWTGLIEVLLGMLVIFAVFLDVSGVILVFAYLLAIYYRAKFTKKGSAVSAFHSSLGVLLGAAVIMVTQAKLYDMSYSDAFYFHSYPQLALSLPDLNGIKSFVFSLGTHPVFIVAIVVISIYWLLSKKMAFTWIMLTILYLFTIKLLKLDIFLQHDFMIYIAISVLLGISVRQYLTSEKEQIKEFVYEKKPEPVVTVIHFEDEPQVTVPERPAIFIPKSMEIPKRVSKPKVDYALEVKDDNMHYDYQVDESADFDI